MTYTVLARKYRPRFFESLVGQDSIVRTLKNALQNGRLHHAYFLTGTRGVGKTTLGRLIAKCLNCEKGISATPCGTCSSCQEIDSGRSLDLIEIDAASNTKVEDTRELLNNVQYAPTRDRFKIYLIDEVHMLSGHSFNALLKTLEEPPAHVKFILATTDPQKLPITILSRCLQFHLKNMAPSIIAKQLQTVCEQEKVLAESAALSLLSESAEGSMRDALSLLDQALAYGNNQVLLNDVETMLGSVKKIALFDLIENLGSKQGPGLLHALEKLIFQGADCEGVLESLLSCFHKLLLVKIIPTALDEDQSFADKYRALSQLLSAEELDALYQIGVRGRADLAFAPSPRIGLEMILLRMLTKLNTALPMKRPSLVKSEARTQPPSDPNEGSQSIQSEILPLCPTQNQDDIRHKKSPASSVRVSAPPPWEENLTIPKSTVEPPSTPIESQRIELSTAKATDKTVIWTHLIAQLNLSGLTLSLAEQCALKSMEDHQITLQIDPGHAALAHESQRKRLQEKLIQHFQKAIVLTIQIDNSALSPAREKQQILDANTQIAQEKLAQDPIAQQLISTFSATIQMNTTTLIE
jgi:DNA polymerase-3 subunit gamma/tau